MATKLKCSEEAALEDYRVAIQNAVNQPAIAASLDKIGYGPEKMREGVALLAKTIASRDNKNKAKNRKNEAYRIFTSKRVQLNKSFTLHRKLAKILFRKDEVTSRNLYISMMVPRTYSPWINVVKLFYKNAAASADIQMKLNQLKLSAEDIMSALELVQETENARADYFRARGVSQNATQIKDEAMFALNEWMRDFYKIARIALVQNPQLLEVLGVVVKR